MGGFVNQLTKKSGLMIGTLARPNELTSFVKQSGFSVNANK